MSISFWSRRSLYLLLWLYLVPLLAAQEAYSPEDPQPPAPPSRSRNISSAEPQNSGDSTGTSEANNTAGGNKISGEGTSGDLNFPQLKLTEVPLDVPGYLNGSGFVRSSLLYRKFIVEAFSGYYGAVLNLYNVDSSEGNSNGNTHEANWNNLNNIIFGGHISGNIRKFHYGLWFGVPLNLGGDYIKLRNYEFQKAAAAGLSGRTKDDLSYSGTFPSSVSSLFLGGLQFGLSVVDRKSAKLTLGLGAEGFIGQWDITGGTGHVNLLLGTDPNSYVTYPIAGKEDQKTISLFAAQVLPFVYFQGGAFLTPFFEIFGSVGYSPATLWATEENRFYELTSTQYRRYGFLGQTILGEFQIRLWLGQRFAVKLGAKGRFTLKSLGTLRTYDVTDSGEPVDKKDFDLTFNAAAMQHLQISVFVGVGLTLDAKLPPGRKYAMPF